VIDEHKFTRRSFLKLAGVATGATVLAACAPQATQAPAPAATEAPAEAAPAEALTLKFWNGFNAHEVDALNEMISEFWDPSHADIKIDATGEQSPEAVLTAISGGEPPDVAVLWDAAPVTLWAEQGAIMDLTPHIEADGLDMEGTFIEAGLAWVQYKGNYVGLPFVNFNYGFYWNKDLFEAAGLDPDKAPEKISELEDYAHQLTTVDDSGAITQLGWMPVNGSFSVDLVLNFGGKFYDPDTGNPTANDSKNIDAFDWDLGLAKGFELDKVTNFTSGFADEGNNPFFLGKLAMSIEGCWNVAFTKEYAPDLNYGIAPVPASDPAYYKSNGVGTNPIIIPNNVDNAEAAWAFGKFLSTNVDVSQNFSDLVANIPQLKSAVEGFSEDANTQFFAELSSSPNAAAWYPIPVAAQYDDELGAAVDKMYTGMAAPKEALDVAQKNLEAALANLK